MPEEHKNVATCSLEHVSTTVPLNKVLRKKNPDTLFPNPCMPLRNGGETETCVVTLH